MTISPITRAVIPMTATIAKTIVNNPVISTIVAGVLTSPYWAQTAEAGASAYMACIDTCANGIKHWSKAVICPTVCAPFLLAPGG